MTDDRIVQRLEEQLRDAHAISAGLRKQLADVEHRERAADLRHSMGVIAERQLEQAHAKQKAAEDNAAAAQRKCDDAEREALRARGELEELRERFEIVKADAERLHVLEDRISKAQHAGDLFAA
jgi:hypothetical protein